MKESHRWGLRLPGTDGTFECLEKQISEISEAN